MYRIIGWFFTHVFQDIRFKLHSKYHLLDVNANAVGFSGINLLASASAYGLVIVASPTSTSFQGTQWGLPVDELAVCIYISFCFCVLLVTQLNDVINHKGTDTIPQRSISLPGAPYHLALSCDHTMLSVCFTANNSSFVTVYSVPTFLSNVSQSIENRLLIHSNEALETCTMDLIHSFPFYLAECCNCGREYACVTRK